MLMEKLKFLQENQLHGEGIDEYTITEVNLGGNELVKLKDEVTFYVTKSKTSDAFVASKVSFDKNAEATTKQVILEDGTQATAVASLSENTVRVIIPNKPIEKPKEFDMALRKNISEVKRDGKTVDIGNRTPVINDKSAQEYLQNKTQ